MVVIPESLGRRDLTLGKLTLPTIHCLAHASPATATALTSALVGEKPCDRGRLREWLAETDSVAYAVSAATRHVALALDQLELLAPSEAKSALTAMAEFIVRRRF